MFESLKNLFKSKDDKRQELISAYLDDALSTRDKAWFKELLDSDQELKNELEQYQWLRQSIKQLPRSKAPRNYILDPAVYSRPASRFPLQIYPALRATTALVAIAFVFLIGLNLISSGQDRAALSTAEESAGRLTADIAAAELAEDALVGRELLQSAPPEVAAEESLPVEAPVVEATVILEAEAEAEKAAAQDDSMFGLERESAEAETPAEELFEEAPVEAVPLEPASEAAEVEESFEGSAADIQSESALPSSSGPLTSTLDGAAAITLTISPTSTFMDAASEDIDAYPGESSQVLGAEEAEIASELEREAAAEPGAEGSPAVSPEPIVEAQPAAVEPTLEPQSGDQSTVDAQANGSTLTILQVVLGASLVLLVGITLLVRSRTKKYY